MTSIAFKDIEAKLTVGALFYECEGGCNYECIVTTKPEVDPEGDGEGRRQARWKAINAQNGVEVTYLATEGLMHYGPRLYTEPQYVHVVDGVAHVRFLGELDMGTPVRRRAQPVATGIFVSASKGTWQVLWDDDDILNRACEVPALEMEVIPPV